MLTPYSVVQLFKQFNNLRVTAIFQLITEGLQMIKRFLGSITRLANQSPQLKSSP
ncbi:hypothetical protein ACKFKF_16815 [Phormidesmis sp. 146-12]